MTTSRAFGRAVRARMALLGGALLLVAVGLSAAPAAAVTGNGSIISGRALNESAEPLAGIRVAVCTTPTSCTTSSTTDANGFYGSGPLVSGRYRIRFTDPKNVYAAGYSTALNTTDRWADARVIVLGTTGRGGVNGNMLPGTAIYGTITGPNGSVVAGATIAACGDPNQLCGSARSTADGRYRVLAGEGRFTVRVRATAAGQAFDGYIGAFGLTLSRDRAVRLLAQPGMQHGASVQLTLAPRMSFVVGSQLSSAGAEPGVKVRVAWAATSAAGTSYVLREREDTGATHAIATPAAATFPGSLIELLTASHAYRFDVHAVTGSVAAAAHTGPTSDLLLYGDTSSQITYAGTWGTTTAANRSGGSARVAQSAGAAATFTFHGRSVAWVTRTGPTAGMAQVFVDGAFAGTFDLSASAAAVRTIAFARSWPAAGTHTVEVTESGIVSHPPVEVDAFLVMD